MKKEDIKDLLGNFESLLEKIDFIMTSEYYNEFLFYLSIASMFSFVKNISLEDLKELFEKIEIAENKDDKNET